MNTLKEIRILHGLSQRSMASLIKVSLSAYEKTERGELQPSRNFMLKVKEGFPDISIDEVFFSKQHRTKTR